MVKGISYVLSSLQDLPNFPVCTMDLSQWQKYGHRAQADFLLACACCAWDSDEPVSLYSEVSEVLLVSRKESETAPSESQSEKSSDILFKCHTAIVQNQ